MRARVVIKVTLKSWGRFKGFQRTFFLLLYLIIIGKKGEHLRCNFL